MIFWSIYTPDGLQKISFKISHREEEIPSADMGIFCSSSKFGTSCLKDLVNESLCCTISHYVGNYWTSVKCIEILHK